MGRLLSQAWSLRDYSSGLPRASRALPGKAGRSRTPATSGRGSGERIEMLAAEGEQNGAAGSFSAAFIGPLLHRLTSYMKAGSASRILTVAVYNLPAFSFSEGKPFFEVRR